MSQPLPPAHSPRVPRPSRTCRASRTGRIRHTGVSASLDVDEHGAGASDFIMAGAPDLNTLGTVATTCNNYTDNTSLDKFVITGYTSFVNSPMFGYGQNQCMYGAAIYCLQQ
jgi:hypothetical protein